MRLLQTYQPSDFDRILLREGKLTNMAGISPALTSSEGTITADTLMSVGGTSVPAGRIWVLTGVTFGANKDCQILLHVTTSGMSSIGTFFDVYGSIGTGGGSFSQTFSKPIILKEGCAISIFYSRSGTEGARVTYSLAMHDITNDCFYDAKKKICVIGDSITWTNAGTITKDSLWAFRVLNALRDEGASVRLINKGFGGSSSVEGASMTKGGYLDFEYDLLFISYGMNDSASGVISENSYKAALVDMITHRDRHNPTASVIVCGAPSTDDPVRTPYIADYRTWASEVVATYASADKVHYVDLSTAYSGSDASYFISGTPKVHPNSVGHEAIFNVLWPVVQNTDFYANL